MVTDDLVHLHVFRVAVLILLGLKLNDETMLQSRYILPVNDTTEQDLEACIFALQAIAMVHITGNR